MCALPLLLLCAEREGVTKPAALAPGTPLPFFSLACSLPMSRRPQVSKHPICTDILDEEYTLSKSRLSAESSTIHSGWSVQDYAEWGGGELDQEIERGFSRNTATPHAGVTCHYCRMSSLSKILHKWRVTVTSG